MSADRGAETDDLGSDENFEQPVDEQARLESYERASAAGPDEFARVVEENISSLADQFEQRTESMIRDLVNELRGALAPDGAQGQAGFIRGAVFGAIVFAGGVLLGRKR